MLNMSFTGLYTLFITFNNTNVVIRAQEKFLYIHYINNNITKIK